MSTGTIFKSYRVVQRTFAAFQNPENLLLAIISALS